MRNLKRALSLALSSVMLLGMMVVGTSAASYPDVDSQDNLEAIEVLEMLGVMSGDEKGNFNPDNKITRNEMAVVMTHLLNLKEGGSTPFTDVPSWAQPYVGAIYNAGVTSGTSATTYGGSANVTATEAALMVMKALGYFGYQGEFGDNWSVAVVKKATQIDLFNGVSASVSSQITRSEAAQICLNALKADVTVVTQTGGANIETGDTSVNITPTYTYETVKNGNGNDYRENGADDKQQLVEKLYAGLKMDDRASVVDDYSRPATKWTYKNETVTAAKTADVVYTAAVKQKDLAKDLGKDNLTGVTEVYNTKNGQAGSLKGDSKIGGNGAIVEVYKDANKIVVTATYAGEIVAVNAPKDGDRTVTVDGMTYKTEAFAKEDIVLYNVKYADSKATIIGMSAATKATSGEVTRMTTADGTTTISVDGTEYKLGAIVSGEAVAVKASYDLYVDNNGYVVYAEKVEEAAPQYAVVLGTKAGWSNGNGSAKLVLADGTQVEVEYKTKSGSSTVEKEKMVSYTVKDGVYTLSVLEGTSLNGAEIKKGNATLTSGVYANDKTVFVVKKDDTYTAYTGIKNVPSMKVVAGNYTADESGIAKMVYVTKSSATGTTAENAIFVAGKKSVADLGDGEYVYTYNAVVDGKITTVEATKALTAGLVNTVTYDNDGKITDAKFEGDENIVNNATVLGTYKNGLLKVDSKYLSCINNVAVFVIDDGEITASSVSSVAEKTYSNVTYILKDGAISALYVTEA